MDHLLSDFGFACELFLTLASREGELGGVTFTCFSTNRAEGCVGELGELAFGLACFSTDGGVELDWEGLEMTSMRSMGGDVAGHRKTLLGMVERSDTLPILRMLLGCKGLVLASSLFRKPPGLASSSSLK